MRAPAVRPTFRGNVTEQGWGEFMAGFEQPDTRSRVDQIVKELAADFDDTPVETIERLVLGSFDELAVDARIETYLPVLTKRVVRERLRHTNSAA